jgi:hypothetical protein
MGTVLSADPGFGLDAINEDPFCFTTIARFPARWNRLAEKESRQIIMLEQIAVGESLLRT